MGEEVDLSRLPPEEEAPAPVIQKGDDEAVYRQVLSLIRQGHKHREVSKSLRALGFTYIDIEKMLSRADAQIYDEAHKQFDYRTAVLVVAAVLAVAAVAAILGSALVSGAVDCGDDAFCSQKVLYCQEGVYKSSFAGTTHEYDIRKELASCRVTERVLESSTPRESRGMSMVCDYPFTDGLTDVSDRYGPCAGSLADAYR